MSYSYRKDVSKKKMGRYQKIVMAIAIILGIFFIVSILNDSVVPPTEEDYVLLEENAIKLVENYIENVFCDEVFSFSESVVTFSVESEKARVTARMPILSRYLDVKDEFVEYSVKFDTKNVEYERESLLKPAYVIITYAIACGIFVMISFYFLFYEFGKHLIKKSRVD